MSEMRVSVGDNALINLRQAALQAALSAAAGRSVNSAELISEARQIEAYLLGRQS